MIITQNMDISVKVKEALARAIGSYFTTNEITRLFKHFQIETNKELSAKWRITLDAFCHVTNIEQFIEILSQFAHPLGFKNPDKREELVGEIEHILLHDDIKITQNGNKISLHSYPTKIGEIKFKTSTDYIIEALNFFKKEYSRSRIKGLKYEFSLGENINSEQVDGGRGEYEEKLNAIKQLEEVGFITEYTIIEKVECEGYYVWDYAVCKIDETKITGEKALPVDPEALSSLTKKIIHEHKHTHEFKNSAQEKPIELKFNENDDSPLLNDRQRFIKIMRYLPEKQVNELTQNFLWNGYYPKVLLDMQVKYEWYSEQLLSEFSNEEINEAYKKMNNTLQILREFQCVHFFVEKDPEYYYLEPGISHKFQSAQTDSESKQWDKLLHELREKSDQFENAYKEFVKVAKKNIETDQNSKSDSSQSTKKLSIQEISFDDDTAKIKVGSQFVSLPPEKNEHWFCRAMFERQKDEAIDWSIIYQEMSGSETTDTKKNKRSVQDAMYIVNRKVKKIIGCNEDLFIWRGRTVTRQY